jgi:membrane fusion protein
MQLPDFIRRAFRLGASSRPQTTLGNFEVTGLHDLGSSIEFRRDTAGTMMVVFFSALAVFVVGGLWFGTFSKQETMRGVVLGAKGSQRVNSTIAGTVQTIWVKQGDTVKPGQKLLTIVPQQTSAGNKSLSEVGLAALKAQSESIDRRMAEIRDLMTRDAGDLKAYEDSSTRLAANLEDQEKDVQRALDQQSAAVDKLRGYLKKGLATRDIVSAQERALQDYKRQLADIHTQIAQLSSTRIDRRRTVEQNNNGNNSQLADLERAKAELNAQIEQAKSAISTDVLAVTGGQVAALNVREGAQVNAGDTVAAIGDPNAQFTIALEAPSKTMGLLTIGQRVVLKYDAFPYKTFGIKYGKVIAIGEQPVSLPKSASEDKAFIDPKLGDAGPLPPPQSKYLVEVEPDDRMINAYGVDRAILVGSTLSADVVVERRKLIDWVIDPILAMRGRL